MTLFKYNNDGWKSLVLVLLGHLSCCWGFRYEAPSDCRWTLRENTEDQVSLWCKLRTINSQFDQTNFSVIPRDYTSALHIECSDSLLYQSSLDDGSFQHLVHLRELTVEYCKLGKLNSGVFRGLRNLKGLAVRSHNHIWPAMSLELALGAFTNVYHLETIDLSQNNIWSLPERLFCGLNNLKVLNLSRNRLQDISDIGLRRSNPEDDEPQEQETAILSTSLSIVSSDSCSFNLQSLDVSANHFIFLPAHGFQGLTHLKTLDLHHNELSSVAEEALAALDHLYKLDMSHNRLVALSALTFSYTPELRELYLAHNLLAGLGPSTFTPLRHLELLSLSGNQLNSIGLVGPVFHGLVRLVVLNLSHNQLDTISTDLFHDLYSLQVLSLDSNALRSIEAGAFTALHNLHTLTLSHNRLTTMDALAFQGLAVLSQLSLDHNQIDALPDHLFRNCTSLQELYLNNNLLTQVPPAIRGLNLLKTLDLGDNEIKSLQNPDFLGLRILNGLRLLGNPLSYIEPETFHPLAFLKILNLAQCHLNTLQAGIFDNLGQLEALRLDSNGLLTLEGLVNRLDRLVWFNVSDNDLRWFDYALLPASLTWLDLHKNKLEELGNYQQTANLSLIEYLDASFNIIASVGSQNIPHSVKQLSLNDNLISVIEPNTFVQKDNLSRVDLFANQLVTLNLNALRLSPTIAQLAQQQPEFYIGGNPFQCDCDMEWLQRINALNNAGQYPRAMDLDSIYCRLSYGRSRSVTPLVEATSSDFLCPYRTHCFALCHCCDFDACDCEMTCPANCTCYHDQSWSANLVDCSEHEFTSIPGRLPMDATDVYLDGNRLPVLPSHAFIGRKNMRTLLLNYSHVESIQNNTFTGLKRLMVLHLDHNLLSSLNGFEFEPLENLRELYLQHNRIASIHPRSFSHMKNLQLLRLDSNAIARFPAWELSTNPYLRTIWLSHNPWSCDCHFLHDFRTWLSDQSKVADSESLQCHDGSSLNLTSCPAGQFTLVIPERIGDFFPLLIATLTAAVLIMTLVILAFACRSPLRAIFFHKCGWRCCQVPEEELVAGEEDPWLYDAYVCYSPKDEAFVHHTMVSELQKSSPSPFKLCFHQSERHHETVLDSMAASRRILVVLSKNFVQTEWTKVGLRTALSCALQGQRQRHQRKLIVVRTEPLNDCDTDPELALIAKSSKVLHWPGSRLFWAQLRLALPEPGSSTHHPSSTLPKASIQDRRLPQPPLV